MAAGTVSSTAIAELIQEPVVTYSPAMTDRLFDLKHIHYAPPRDGRDIQECFAWEQTPEGFDYWFSQFQHGPDAECLAKLEAMQRQWESENQK